MRQKSSNLVLDYPPKAHEFLLLPLEGFLLPPANSKPASKAAPIPPNLPGQLQLPQRRFLKRVSERGRWPLSPGGGRGQRGEVLLEPAGVRGRRKSKTSRRRAVSFRPESPSVKRRRPRGKGRSLSRALVAGAFVLFAGWLGLYTLPEKLGPLFFRSVLVRDGAVEVGVQTVGVVLRREAVVPSPSSGTLSVVAAEGIRVPAGDVVAYVNPPGAGSPVPVKSPTAGVISFELDRYSGNLDTSGVFAYEKVDIARMSDKPHVLAPGSQVEPGQPAFRVVDNFEFFVYVIVPETLGLAADQKVWVRFGASGEDRLPARVVSQRPGADGVKALLLVRDHHPGALYWRKPQVDVIQSRVEGAIVPKSSLVQRGGRTGVFLAAVGGPVFKDVRVKGTDGTRFAVNGLPDGVRVVTNPWIMRLLP